MKTGFYWPGEFQHRAGLEAVKATASRRAARGLDRFSPRAILNFVGRAEGPKVPTVRSTVGRPRRAEKRSIQPNRETFKGMSGVMWQRLLVGVLPFLALGGPCLAQTNPVETKIDQRISQLVPLDLHS